MDPRRLLLAVVDTARRRWISLRGARRGAHSLEFALTLPVFVLILAATFDMGWLFFQQAMLDNAMHEGCRAGAVIDPEQGVPEDVAEEEMRGMLASVGQECGGSASDDGDTDTDPPERGIGDPQTCDFSFSRQGSRPAISLKCEVVRSYTPPFGLVPHPDYIGSQTLMRFEWQDLVDES